MNVRVSTASHTRRGASLLVAFAYACCVVAPAAAAQRALETFTFPDGRVVSILPSGAVQIQNKRRHTTTRQITLPRYTGFGPSAPSKADVIRELIAAENKGRTYAPGRVIVVYRDDVATAGDTFAVPAALAGNESRFTSDARTNHVLTTLGTAHQDRLFAGVNRSLLSAAYTARLRADDNGASTLNPAGAYRLEFTHTSVNDAVRALLALPTVAYASPEWLVESMRTAANRVFPAQAQRRAVQMERRIPAGFGRSLRRGQMASTFSAASSTLPTNYALTSSLQSLLNAPGLDVPEAYDLIASQYNQLPGAGETITNVSLGDLDDATETKASDPCSAFVADFTGPTTVVIAGQRYLDWPSMPLIPTYTADNNGKLNGDGAVCGVDPLLGEVGLDFSVMAPLPHAQQRSSNLGSGYTDLLGIAPGANYRLVVPASSNPTFADIDAALLAAGQQTPHPNVITASLGFGEDSHGFPSRYLEDDPLSESIIASLVKSGIVVCIAGGDGLRLFTGTAISPSGGSAPTNLVSSKATPSALADVAFSTTPSLDPDSGAIAVGATTLDDIFAAPPQNSAFASLSSQHAFADTRWTGSRDFSSAFGSRINAAAPGDNITTFAHTAGGSAQAVDVGNNGGTSASAPEVAAAVAVMLQVGRLTGHPFASPAAVRTFLSSTGTAIPAVPQSDVANTMGLQVDLGRAVATLFSNAKIAIAPSVARVAVEQRRNADYGLGLLPNLDGVFISDTDPTNIDLAGPAVSPTDSTLTAADQLAWITIAPDWEGLPAGAKFTFTLAGSKTVLATTPWVRMLPATLLAAAGLPLQSSGSRTVNFTYSALSGKSVVASTTIPLTFGPLAANPLLVLAPSVPAVVTGSSFAVAYDLSRVADLASPKLIVSRPGRVDPVTGVVFDASYTVALLAGKGTVNVPVSSLHGGGIYGIGIQYGSYAGTPLYSDFAFTRISPTATSRAAAPVLSAGTLSGHTLEIAYGTPFKVAWNVASVSKATAAMLEISAAAPGAHYTLNTVNNPNGSVRDADGADSGSIYFATLSGTQGTISLNPATVGMVGGFSYNLRVLPVSGSNPVGEAGEISTLTEDGLTTTDGGFITGLGLNRNGNDGYLTSQSGVGVDSSIQIIDRTKKIVTKTISSSKTFYEGPFDIFDNDVSLIWQTDSDTNYTGSIFLNPTTTGTIGQQLMIPAGIIPEVSAENQSTATAAFVTADDNGDSAFLTVNMLTGASTLFPEKIPLDFDALAGDVGAGTVYAKGIDTTLGDCSSSDLPVVVAINVSTGAAKSITIEGAGLGAAQQLAYDPSTGILAMAPACETSAIGLYNVNTKAAIKVPVPSFQDPGFAGSSLRSTVIDPTNHLVFAINTLPPDLAINNNRAVSVVIIDEKTASIVKTLETFGAGDANPSFGDFEPSLLVDGTRREGWVITSPTEITPFSY